MTCSSSSYTLIVTKTIDDTYDFEISQTDRASNQSTSVAFQWIRDTSLPATPVITNPSSNPFHSKLSSLTISGTCVTGHTVFLNGDDTQSTTCSASSFSFTVSATVDDSYDYAVTQQNPDTSLTSAADTQTWNRDTVAPSAPTITNPTSSPFTSSTNLTIDGSCETGSTVYLTGDDTQNATCTSATYNFTVIKGSDGTYNFSIYQTDQATNTSGTVTQQWVRDNSIPAAPTITTPASEPFISNNTTLTLAGSCITGYTVYLSGDVSTSDVTSPAASLSQTCTSNAYSYTVTKSVDATYSFSVTQENLSGTPSSAATRSWILDRVAPNTTIATNPTDPNLGTTATFSFTSTESGTFSCSLDGASYTTCTSPITLTGLSNGAHTFDVRATDGANNTDATPASYSWTQNAGSTLALYHLDLATFSADSSTYMDPYNNPLTNSGSTNNATGKFSQARSFNGTSQSLSALHTASLAQATATMTIEAFIYMPTLPSNSSSVIAGKNGASGQYGWEFGVRKQGSNHRLYFKCSSNGTSTSEVTSSNLTAAQKTAVQGGYIHVAAVLTGGSAYLYFDGVSIGNNTCVTSLFNNSSTPLTIGSAAGTNYFLGSIDEVRLSQTARYSGTSYTVPTSAFTAD